MFDQETAVMPNGINA